MSSYLKHRFTPSQVIAFIVLACLFWLAGSWVSRHFWFPLDARELTQNGRTPGLDYEILKSWRGDIFIHTLDHEPQYLISPKGEVSVISEEEDFSDTGFFLYTSDALADLDNPQIKSKVADAKVIMEGGCIEFTPSGDEHWRICS